jgi:hypothetical protein
LFSRAKRLAVSGLGAVLLLGGPGVHASTRAAGVRTASGEGVAACLKAEGVRVPETARQNRIVARRARNYPIVGVRYAGGETVVIWERGDARLVRRVYLEWPGTHGTGSSTPRLRRRSVRLVVRHAAQPHRPSSVGVTFSNGTRRAARRLEKTCLHSRP